jgi:Rps23 Pro-64 3,4-dihydroxylase Tpa1-like proline 4-hydroxylase
MFDINEIYKIQNFLSVSEIKGLNHLSNHYPWTFDAVTDHEKVNNFRLFWNKDFWQSSLGQCKEIEQCFRIKLEDYFNIKLKTCRLYLNGQAHGQCGSVHKDVEEDTTPEKYITLIYYMNEIWKPEYGGFTVIEDNTKHIHIVYPEPNSAVIFNSRLNHVGLEPTIHCTDQRVTLAHKMKILKE